MTLFSILNERGKRMFKRTILLISLSLFIVTTPFTPLASANEIPKANTADIVISNGLSIPQEIIQDLKESNPDAELITIYEYGEIQSVPDRTIQSNTPPLSPLSLTYVYRYTNSKSVTQSDVLVKDEFKFSVAKGEEVTLSQTYTGSLKGSISGSPYDKGTIGADITITAQYTKGTKYSGPSESSSYNTREFRMKFYEERGTWKQIKEAISTITLKVIATETKTGSYNKPTRYLSYSVDKRI